MDFLIDLQRLIWHETGHLCLDILENNENKNHQIEKLLVEYHGKAISHLKWSGLVDTNPKTKFEDLVDDSKKTSFALLNTISGCVFQTIFLNDLQKQNVVFKDCFYINRSCAGRQDFMSFYEIGSQYRKKFGKRDDYLMFSEVKVIDEYYNLVSKNEAFVSGINNIVLQYQEVILASFEASKKKNEFLYEIKNEELETLKDSIQKVMKDSGFEKSIIELLNNIFERIENDKAMAKKDS